MHVVTRHGQVAHQGPGPVGNEHYCKPHVFKSQEAQDNSNSWGKLSIGDALSYLEQTVAHTAELPSIESLVGILQQCRKEKNLVLATLAHVHICSNGLEAHEVVWNHLIPMFVECGSVPYAQQVFLTLAHSNVQTWTSLIQGYAECGEFQLAFDVYQQMQRACVQPSRYTFLALLKACVRLKSIEKGHKIHMDIAEEGLERDSFIGNALVDMYAKCGLLTEALEVFNMLPARDVVSWNALMVGYAEHKLYEDVLNFLEQMQADGVSSNAITSTCSLKACASICDIGRGRGIHSDIAKEGFEKHPSVVSTLVDMYAKCGFLAEAQEVFDELPVRDVVLWTVLIAGYTEHGHSKEAIECLKQMQQAGLSPDAVTLLSILKSCGNVEAIDQGRETHSFIVKKGLESDVSVGNTLVDMYARCHLLAEAHEVVNKLITRDVVSWNALITGYADYGMGEEVLNCLDRMRLDGVSPDVVTFVCGLKGCGSIEAMDAGLDVHTQIVSMGFDTAPFIGNALVDMHAKCASLVDARGVFDKLLVRDIVSWNTLIAGYVAHGHGEEALSCLESVQLERLILDAVAYSCVIRACAIVEAIDKGQELHAEIVKEGFEGDPFVGNALVDMYAMYGSMDEAREVFDELPIKDQGSWNTLISGYAECGLGGEVLTCLDQMQAESVLPDAVTFVCILKAYGVLGVIESALATHAEVAIEGFEAYYFVGNTLVGIYAKAGLLAEAQEVFEELPTKDVISWNTLLAGYVEHGFGEEALNCLERMQWQASPPNAVTYVCILKACGNIGTIDRGQEIHAEIAKEGFERDPFVGTTLVDLYAKSGLLLESQEVFDELQGQDIVSWNTLLAGYAEHGLSEKVLLGMEQIQLDGMSPNIVTFVSALKACDSMGALDKGREVFTEITKRGFERDPFVSNKLVDMHAKCGSLAEARELFDGLQARDVVSWNALIAGYNNHGLFEDVLSCFEQMQSEGLSPDVFTFSCSLKACGSMGAIARGQEIHSHITKGLLEIDSFVGNSLVEMYAKCGLLAEAFSAFSVLAVQSVSSWNALIAGYIEHGRSGEALDLLEDMQMKGVPMNSATFFCSLKACAIVGAVERSQDLHSKIVKEGFEANAFMGSTLVDTYAKCGLLAEGWEVLDKLPVRDVVSWTVVIAGYAEHGLPKVAMHCFEQMQLEGVPPDAVTYLFVLKACDSIGALDKGQEIHAEITTKGFETDPLVGKALVDMYARYGTLPDAQVVFDELRVQDVVLWNILIAGYLDNKLCEKALNCLKKMQLEGVLPNVVSWNTLILGYAENGESGSAFLLYMHMQEQGVAPDTVTFLSILKACGNVGVLEVGKKVHAQCHKLRPEDSPDASMMTALIDMYGKCGSMINAQQTFDAMPSKDVVGWTALITGYARQGETDLVFHLFEKMMEEGIQPDMPSYLSILAVCNHAGLVDKGQKYFEDMSQDYGFVSPLKNHNCLTDLLGRAGQLDEAMMMLEKMPLQPDLATCNTLLGACQKQGDVEHGRQAFERAVRLDDRDAAAFILMRNIYIDAEFWEETEMNKIRMHGWERV